MSGTNGRHGGGVHVYLFTYGTLRRGGAASPMMEGAERVGPASVEGTLYDIDGQYPALLLAGSGQVDGELWRIPSAMLLRLDEYEAVEEGLFRRVALRVGDTAAWTYVAGPTLAPLLTPERRLDGVWNPADRGGLST